MSNLFFLKFEIIIFFLSSFYFVYYIFERIFLSYFNIKKIVSPIRKETVKTRKNIKQNEKSKENVLKVELNLEKSQKNNKKNKISDKEKLKIKEIIKKVKIHSSKWYFETARWLIIEWLAIDKYNKSLNLQLAEIYEKENNYKKAEFIYRDLSQNLPNDLEIRKKLAFNLAVWNNLAESLKIYEMINKKNRWDIEVIEMLTDISFNLKKYKKSLKFVNLFLKENSRNVWKLFIKWESLEKLWKKQEAKEIFNKILQLQPYNTKAIDFLKNLNF